jgi:hypothetical protein
LSSAPGTIIKEMEVPSPERPARQMQREANFTQTVFAIRDVIEQFEAHR